MSVVTFAKQVLNNMTLYCKTPLNYTTLHVASIYEFKDKLIKFCDIFR